MDHLLSKELLNKRFLLTGECPKPLRVRYGKLCQSSRANPDKIGIKRNSYHFLSCQFFNLL
jgi:hypothetical protein